MEINIKELVQRPEIIAIKQNEAIFKGTQYNSLQYDWDGKTNGYLDASNIAVGYKIPYAQRKPSERLQIGSTIVKRLTAFMFGTEKLPKVAAADSDIKKYVEHLFKQTRLATKIRMMRSIGGGTGLAVCALSYVKGKARIVPLKPDTVHVIEWADEYELEPKKVCQTYQFYKPQYDNKTKKYVQKKYYFLKIWDTETTETWEEIPDDLCESYESIESVVKYHNAGLCPIVMTQNIPNIENSCGLCDYHDVKDLIPTVDRLASSVTRGLFANLDPTLIIHDEPLGDESIKKGSENAIYSKGGASYLELSGSSTQAGLEMMNKLISQIELNTGVRLGDVFEMAAKAQSAAAMKVMFAQMISTCNTLRTQYGELIKKIVYVLHEMALNARLQTKVTETESKLIEQIPQVELPRDVLLPENCEFGLEWPEYFAMTPKDMSDKIDGAIKARGVLVSDETATRYISEIFGVDDVLKEVEHMYIEQEKRAEMLESPELYTAEEEEKYHEGN